MEPLVQLVRADQSGVYGFPKGTEGIISEVYLNTDKLDPSEYSIVKDGTEISLHGEVNDTDEVYVILL